MGAADDLCFLSDLPAATDGFRAAGSSGWTGGGSLACIAKKLRKPRLESSNPAHLRMAGLSHLGRWRVMSSRRYRSSAKRMAPWSFLCRRHRPTAWFNARNACCEYHWSPESNPRVTPSLLYSRLSSTRLSLTLGYGTPTTTTPLALASAKSIPSETLPRTTANKTAPRAGWDSGAGACACGAAATDARTAL